MKNSVNEMDIKTLLTICLILVCITAAKVSGQSLCPEVPNCDCRPNTDKVDIYCTELENLSVVDTLLHTRFAHKAVNKLMLKYCSVTTLPNNSFSDSTISIFISWCPFQIIEENALTKVNNLSKVIFQNTTFSTIPVGLQRLKLKTLNILFNKLESLTNELANLPTLLFLSLREGLISNVSEDAFLHTPDIIYLDLSYNKMEYLHPDTFDPLKHLRRIAIRGNQLLTVDGFLKLQNPELVDFYDNNLTSAENIFHHNMWAVKSVNLGKNPIEFINASAFRNKINNLEILDLSASKYEEVDPMLLQSFRLLKEVLFARNKLVAIPPGFFNNLMSLNEVDLTSNNLTSIDGAFHKNPYLEVLLLSRNRIHNIVNAFYSLPKLWRLYASNNYIEGIYDGDFATLPSLKQLILSHNDIRRLDSTCFVGLYSLNVLELSSNKFRSFNYSVQHLLLLNELSAKSGSLETIEDNELTGLPKLEIVNLVYNRLKNINGAFRQLSSLKSLNLAKNKLKTMSRDTFPAQIKLNELYLAAGNQWICDCRLLWLAEWIEETNGTYLKDEPFCHTPDRLRLKLLRNLTAYDLIIWPEDCPDECTCQCQPQNRDFYIKVDCSHKGLNEIPSTLPDYLGDFDFQNNSLANFTDPSHKLLNYIQILRLSNNIIESINFELPETLNVLHLDGNDLTRFPHSLLKNKSLTEVTLSRNPWICDCETVDFRKWLLSEGDIVIDVNETRCGDDEKNGILRNKVIISLNDTDLCPSVVGLIVSVTIGSLVVLLFGTSMFLAYSRYHLYLKVWLYARGLTWVKEEDMDTDKMFDALVSYSPTDRDLVFDHLVRGLEDVEPSFILCIPERDIVAGTHETQNLDAIIACKRIIIILTKDFLNNGPCMETFRTALAISLDDKVHRIIVIKYGDLPPVTEMDQSLKTVIESTNCLEWGEKLFWEKLRFAMPKKKKMHPSAMARTSNLDSIMDQEYTEPRVPLLE